MVVAVFSHFLKKAIFFAIGSYYLISTTVKTLEQEENLEIS